MKVKNYILATAGHIDHGKSALVRALTGIDPDRLPEEKARGITIDLGFAHLDLPLDGSIARVGIIDVPGHEDFVKNMVAGVGSIDLALLAVAADDGWMPQTEEHLQILDYLSVSQGVVVLTKCDLRSSIQPIEEELRRKLLGSALADAPIVPTSIVSGHGIEELKQTIAQVLRRLATQPDIGKPRLPVDRAFTLHGIGTVVTGTLTGGTLDRGQSVVVQPSGVPARIRTIQSYSNQIQQATPGSRVALNLPDLQPGITVKRGEVITLSHLGNSGDTLDLLLEVSDRLPEAPTLKHGTMLWAHHGSGSVPAHVHSYDASSLVTGSRAPAQLRLDRPIFAFIGDRLVLRDWTQRRTLAGAIVIEPHASRRASQKIQRRQFLESQTNHLDDLNGLIAAMLARDGIAVRSQLLLQSRFSDDQIREAIETLAREGRLVLLKDRVADLQWWGKLRSQALEAIDGAHAAHPETAGLPLAELRPELFLVSEADVADAMVEELCKDVCVRDEMTIRRAGHRPALPAHLREPARKIVATLLDCGLNPPARSQLASDPVSKQALRFLIQSGQLIEMTPDVVIHAEHYEKARSMIRKFLANDRCATISQLKAVLATTRRVMVPLAEKLDRDGVTSRRGDMRSLRAR